MKGNAKLIEVLNSLLADELTAVNQYIETSQTTNERTKADLWKTF
jgi:bacterioferritin (cytochrome b1)